MSQSRLELIDIIRERTGLGYREAAELLDAAKGDVVEALAAYEAKVEAERAPWVSLGKGLLDRLAELAREGNVTRVRIKKGERVVAEVPVTAGIVGAIIAPELALLSGALCLFNRWTIEVEREDGQVKTEVVQPF